LLHRPPPLPPAAAVGGRLAGEAATRAFRWTLAS
jgi:hypothetical protein